MAEVEGRPSKIRKLGPPNGTGDVHADVQAKFEDNEGSSNLAIEKEILDIKKTTLANLEHNEKDGAAGEDGVEGTPSNNSTAPAMSKNQLKKLHKKAAWEAGKDYRKQQKKAKEAAKKAQRAAEKAALLAAGAEPTPPKLRPVPSTQVPITLLLDCGFDDYMIDKEIMSLGQQITRSYSDNKHARYRAHLVISSFGGRLKERYETVLSSHHLGWKGVTFSEKFFVDAAKDAHDKMVGPEGGSIDGALLGKKGRKDDDQRLDEVELSTGAISAVTDGDVSEPPRAPKTTSEEFQQPSDSDHKAEEQRTASSTQSANDRSTPIPSESTSLPQALDIPIPVTPQIVYLSSDSEHTLDVLSPYTTYVIGGIVDKNRHKGLCYKRATELGIPTAKLPIGEYMQMQSRAVLATNHVVEIMANWLDKGDWGEAFLKAIPKRKEAILRKNRDKQKRGQNREGEDEDVQDVQDEETERVDTENKEGTPESSGKLSDAISEEVT